MAYLDDIDQRQVKRGKFGPLDVFPQEDKQREDELNTENVKNGFKYMLPDILKEYEFQSLGLKDNSLNSNFEHDIYRSLLAIINKREDNSTLNDAGKKQPQNKLSNPFKPTLLHITAKSKDAAFAWFKSLADNDSLMKLAKKIPVFNKRAENLPEIILTLNECNVPITRSVWYIKMLAAQATTLNEVQKKKRQTNLDPSNEWTIPLVRLLRELFNRMKDINTLSQSHQQTPQQLQQQQAINVATIESFMINESSNLFSLTSNYLTEEKIKNLWDYTIKLMRSMLDQNLLDKQMILDFIIDLLEKSKLFDKNLKLILTIVVQNINHFLQSELLSRRLAYYCCKKLGALFNDQLVVVDNSSTTNNSKSIDVKTENLQQQQQQQQQQSLHGFKFSAPPTTPPQSQLTSIQTDTTSSQIAIKDEKQTPTKPNKKTINHQQNLQVNDVFKQYLDCSFHKDIIILLTSITHSIVLGCSQALIWNHIGDGKECPFNGSPLDFLPCAPSELLFTYNNLDPIRDYIKYELEKAELCIKRRSIAIENKWSTEQLQQVAGMTDNKILAMLDLLDKNTYDFEALESLYNQLFKKPQMKEGSQNEHNSSKYSQIMSEQSIIHLLCEWAITTKRNGLHRAFYVVLLLRKRQKELAKEIYLQKRQLEHKLRLNILKEAKRLKKIKNKLILQQKDLQILNTIATTTTVVPPVSTSGIVIKEENPDIMEIDMNNSLNNNNNTKTDLDNSLNISATTTATNSNELNTNKTKTFMNDLITNEFNSNNKNINSNNSINNKIVKKTKKKKNKKLKHKQYELELQELTNSFLLQNILVEYLEIKSNYIDENSTESRLQFANLITLYYLFINFKLFSHNSFICTLISRGETFRNLTNDDYYYKDIMSVPPSVKNPQSVQSITHYQNIDSRKSIDFNSDIHLQPHQLQHQKSVDSLSGQFNINGLNTADVFDDQHDAQNIPVVASSSLSTLTANSNTSNQISKLTNIVLNLPLPQNDAYQHERNQRFIVLYGFGSKRQEIQKKTKSLIKDLLKLFNTKSSIDLNEILNNTNYKLNLKEKIFQIQDNTNNNELYQQLIRKYQQLSYYDQYYIISVINDNIISQFKNLNRTNILPSLLNIQFIFDLMEYNNNIMNILIFSIRLIKIIPQYVENYLYKNSSFNNNNQNKLFICNYISLLYFNIVGVLRLYLPCLILWHDLTIQVFKSLYNIVKHVDTPKKCSSHEKCVLMLMNELFISCSYIKDRFPKYKDIYDKVEKLKTTANKDKEGPDKSLTGPYQLKNDELLINMISKTDYNLDQVEAHVSKLNSYNFVAQVFMYIANASKEDVLRVGYLCGEVTSRLFYLTPLWQLAIKALCSRGDIKEKPPFSEIASKINIQSTRVQENFQSFFCSLVGSNSLILHDFIIAIVRTCVIASPHFAATADPSHNGGSVETCALFACQIIKFLCTSSPKALQYRPTSFSQRLLVANFRSMSFNTFLLILKGLFLLSPYNNDNNGSKNDSKKDKLKTKLIDSSQLKNSNSDEHFDINQYAGIVLQEICSQDWIKERCLKEGENLLKPVHLLESALQKPQTLLRIICYPENHHLRSINDQITSTKDVIRNILQNLDIWTLRESLLELKLMIEIQKSKDCHYDHLIKCLAKTTVDLLVDPEVSKSTTLRNDSTVSNLNTSITNNNTNTNVTNNNNSINNSNKNNNSLNSLHNANSDDNVQISFHLNDNFENENSTNNNIPSATPPSSSSSSNLDPQNNDVMNLNIPSVGKASTSDNDMGENANSQLNNNNNNNINNEFLNQTDFNDSTALSASSSNADLFDMNNYKPHREPRGIWLIAPLIIKLQDNCQARILEHAAATLQELGKSFWAAKTKAEKESQASRNMTAWSQPPFFALLLSCIKCQEEQKPLLTSLFNQLNDFINGKEDKILAEDPRLKQLMMRTLHIRLSLVGKMFDYILKNSSDYANWAWLFVQLIYLGVVDPDTDQLLFTMVIDMLAVLIHHIISLELNLESNKFYQLIVKRISKDTFNDFSNNKAINHIRRLLPLNRITTADLVTVEPYNTSTSKNSMLDRRKGYKFSRKERVSNWELIEGVKNASSLCLSWYGATKLERKVLRYEYQQKLLIRHSHGNIQKDSSYFKELPEVPNDIIIQEPPKEVPKLAEHHQHHHHQQQHHAQQQQQQQQQQQLQQSQTLLPQQQQQQQQMPMPQSQQLQNQPLNQLNNPNLLLTSSQIMHPNSNINQMQAIINNTNTNILNNNMNMNQGNMMPMGQNMMPNNTGNNMNMNLMNMVGTNALNNKPMPQQPNNMNYPQMINNNNQMPNMQANMLNNTNMKVPRMTTPEKQRGANRKKQTRGGRAAGGGGAAPGTAGRVVPGTTVPPPQQPQPQQTQMQMGMNTPPIILQNNTNPANNTNWQQTNTQGNMMQSQTNNIYQTNNLNGPTNAPTSMLHTQQQHVNTMNQVNSTNTSNLTQNMRPGAWNAQPPQPSSQTSHFNNNPNTNTNNSSIYQTQAPNTTLPPSQMQQISHNSQQYLQNANQPFNNAAAKPMPTNTPHTRAILQPNNRVNYQNAPINAQNQIPMQQAMPQSNPINNSNNDVTIINPNLQHQKILQQQQQQQQPAPSQQPQQIPQLQPQQQQQQQQQQIASNKRKYPDTGFPNQQQNNPNMPNANILPQQQQPPPQQNPFQAAPPNRVITQQQNNAGNYGNFTQNTLNDQLSQNYNANQTNQMQNITTDFSSMQKSQSFNNTMPTNVNNPNTNSNMQTQNFNLQSNNRIYQNQQNINNTGNANSSNPSAQNQNLMWQRQQLLARQQQQTQQQQQSQQNQQQSMQQSQPQQQQFQQMHQQPFLQKQSSQILTPNQNPMMQQQHLQRHMTAPATQYHN